MDTALPFNFLRICHRDRSKHRKSKHEKMRDKIPARRQLSLNPNPENVKMFSRSTLLS